MESAVMSGIEAAGAALGLAGKTRVRPRPIEPPSVPVLRAAKYAALPMIAPLGLWSWWRRRPLASARRAVER
jgi:hypothetical protein